MINSLSTQQINLNAEALPRSPVHVHTNHSLLCIINSQFTIKTFHTMETLRLSKKPKKLPFRTIGSKKWRKQTYPKVAILWRLTPSGEFFSHFWPFLGHYWLFSQKPLTSRGLHYYGMILLYIWVRFKNFPPLGDFYYLACALWCWWLERRVWWEAWWLKPLHIPTLKTPWSL